MYDIAPSGESSSAPFVAEHVRQAEAGSSRFTPHVRLILEVASLRRSGLLTGLPDDCARTLVAVLCFLTPNGRAEPTAHQVADVLGISLGRARERLLRLASVLFRDESVLRVRQTESGLEMFGVSPRVLASRDEEPHEEQSNAVAAIESHREAVINHSRGAHARPRAEVERMVLEQLGLPEPEVFDDTREGVLRKRLSGIGVTRESAESLLAEFGPDAVERQLDWLPHRHAKDPARYLIAAVRGNYTKPQGNPVRFAEAPGERTRKDEVADDLPASGIIPTPPQSVVPLPIPAQGAEEVTRLP